MQYRILTTGLANHPAERTYGSAEAAGAALADLLGWPGFCLGEWDTDATGRDTCAVYESEHARSTNARVHEIQAVEPTCVEIWRTRTTWAVRLPKHSIIERKTLSALQRLLKLGGYEPVTTKPRCLVFRKVPPTRPLDVLTRAVRDALAAYESTGDHQHVRGFEGDCIACKLREAMR